MGVKQAPTPEQIAAIPLRLDVLPQQGSPFQSKPPEGKQGALDRASADISNASKDLQAHANNLNNAMMSDRAMHSHAVRHQLERVIDDEEDRREMRDEIHELETEAAHAEEAREEGDDDVLATTADSVRTGIEDLGGIAGAADALRSAGADPSVISALRSAARDMRAGENDAERQSFRERGNLTVEMARFYAENLPTLRMEGMQPIRQALERAIAALGSQAREGTSAQDAAITAREAGGLFARLRGTVQDRAGLERAAATARLQDYSSQCAQMRPSVQDEGLRREIDGLRRELDDARTRLSRGERVSDRDLGNLQGRAELLQNARDNLLAGRTGPQAQTLQGMLGRALSALSTGNPDQSAAQIFMAQQFVRAGREFGEQLSRHSQALAAGTEQIGASLQFLSNNLASALERFTGGPRAVQDEASRSLLGRILSGLRGGTQSVDGLERASLALTAAERLSDAESRISRMPQARRSAASGVLGIFRNCLQALSGGGRMDEAGIQLEFADRHATAPPQVRGSIERMSSRLMTGTNIRAMDRILSRRELPTDPQERRRAIASAAREALGESASEEDVNALTDSFDRAGANAEERSSYVDGIVRQCAGFLSLLNRRSALERNRRRPPGGSSERELFSQSIASIDSLLHDIGQGNEVDEGRVRSVQMQGALLDGDSEQLSASYATSEDSEERRGQLEAVSGLDSIQNVLSGLGGPARERVAGIYQSAMEALSENRHEDAIALCSFAQAYARGNAQDRTRILIAMERYQAGLGPPSETRPAHGAQPLAPSVGRAMARLFLDRSLAVSDISDRTRLAEYRRYSDLALNAVESGDENGAALLGNIASLYARAAALEHESTESSAALDLAGGNSGLGIPSLDSLEESLSGDPPRTVAEALFPDSNPESAALEMQGLGLGLEEISIGLGIAEFDSRSVDLGARTSVARYNAERGRLAALRDHTEDEGERARLEHEISVIDGQEIRQRFTRSHDDYVEGAGLLRQAIRRRAQALRTEDPGERERLNAEAENLAQRGVIILESAEGNQTSLLTLHRSVMTLRTRNREDGRSDLFLASERFEEAAEYMRTAPEGELSDSQRNSAIQLVESASGNLQSGSLHVAQQWAIQRQASSLLRWADSLEERNEALFNEVGRGAERTEEEQVPPSLRPEQPEETYAALYREAGMEVPSDTVPGDGEPAGGRRERHPQTVYMPVRPGEEVPREPVYRQHIIQQRIDAGRRAARSERFASSRRLLGSASERMDIEIARVEAVTTFSYLMSGDPSRGVLPASRSEQSMGDLEYFDLESQLRSLERAGQAADRGRLRESSEIRGDVHDTVLVSGERQRRYNMVSYISTNIEDLEGEQRVSGQSGSFGVLGEEERRSMDRDTIEAHNRIVASIRGSGVLDGVDSSREAVLEDLRDTRGEIQASIESVHDIDDLPNADAMGLLASAAADYGMDSNSQGLLLSDRQAAERLEQSLDDPRAVSEILEEHPALLRGGAQTLVREQVISQGAADGLIADNSFRTSVGEFQEHAVGWNLALTAASRAVSMLDRTDQLIRASRGTRQNRAGIRSHAVALLQLAHYAGDHSERVAEDIESGRPIITESLDISVGGGGVYDGFHIRQGQLTEPRIVDIYSRSVAGEMQILQDIGNPLFGFGPDGPQAADEEGRAFSERLGPRNWRLVTGQYEEAMRLSQTEVRLTFAGLGFDADFSSGLANRIELRRDEQLALQEAMGSIASANGQFLNIISSLRSWISQDEAGSAFAALAEHARVVENASDQIIRHPGQGEAEVESLRASIRDSTRLAMGSSAPNDLGRVGALIREGRDEEWYWNTGRTIAMIPLSAVLMSTGLGIPMAGYFLYESIASFDEMLAQAGSWDSMRTEQRILGIGGIALAGLGFATAGASAYLSELGSSVSMFSAPAGQLSRGTRLLQSAVGASGYTMMVGGLGLGLVQMYDMHEHGGEDVRILDYILAGFQAAQPFLQMGGHTAASRWRPNLMYGTGTGARMYRLGMFGLFGVTRQQTLEQYYFSRREAFTRRLNSAPEGVTGAERRQYIEGNRAALSQIEQRLGRPLDASEGLALLEHFSGSDRRGRARNTGIIDPASGADMLLRFEEFAQSETARMSEEFRQDLSRISDEAGRELDSQEILTLARAYPDGIPDTGTAMGMLESARAQGNMYSISAFEQERSATGQAMHEPEPGGLLQEATPQAPSQLELMRARRERIEGRRAEVQADAEGAHLRPSDSENAPDDSIAAPRQHAPEETVQERVSRMIGEASELRAQGRFEEARAIEAEYVALERGRGGNPPEPGGPNTRGPGPRNTTDETSVHGIHESEIPSHPSDVPAPVQEQPQATPQTQESQRPRLRSVRISQEEQALDERATLLESGNATNEQLAVFAIELSREIDGSGPSHQLLERMSMRARDEMLALMNSDELYLLERNVPADEVEDAVSRGLRFNRALRERLGNMRGRLMQSEPQAEAREAQRAVNYGGPEPDIQGQLLHQEGGGPRPDAVIDMARGGFSTARIQRLTDALVRGGPVDSPQLAREAELAQNYMAERRRGIMSADEMARAANEASAAALAVSARDLAYNIERHIPDWVSGDSFARSRVISDLQHSFPNSPDTVSMVVDTLTYFDYLGYDMMNETLQARLLGDSARSIVQSWDGYPEPIRVARLHELANMAYMSTHGIDGNVEPLHPISDPAEARALGRMLLHMQGDVQRGWRRSPAHYLDSLPALFPEFDLLGIRSQISVEEPVRQELSPGVSRVSPIYGHEHPVQRRIVDNLQENLTLNPRALDALRRAGLHLQVVVNGNESGETTITVNMLDRNGSRVDLYPGDAERQGDFGSYNSRRVFPPDSEGREPTVWLDWVGVPEVAIAPDGERVRLRECGLSDVINLAVDDALHERDVRTVYLQAAEDGRNVWPRRGYSWVQDMAQLDSIGDNQPDFALRTWEGPVRLRERFAEWALANPDWLPPNNQSLEEFIAGASDHLERYPRAFIETALSADEPQNVQERFIRWYVDGGRGTVDEACEFLERYGNRPRYYPSAFLNDLGALYPLIRPSSLSELPSGLRGLPEELHGLLVDPQRGPQHAELLRPIDDVNGSGGAIYLGRMLVDGRQCDVAIKISRTPRALHPERARFLESGLSELYSRYQDAVSENPSNWARLGGFTPSEERALLRMQHLIDSGLAPEDAIRDQAVFANWEDLGGYFINEVEAGQVLGRLDVGPQVYGRVDVGDGNMAFAMDIINGIDSQGVRSSQLEAFARSRGVSVEDLTDSILSQVGSSYELLLRNNWESQGDFQFALLTRPQAINGRPRLAGDVIFWDPGSFRRASLSDGLDYVPAPRPEPGQPEAQALNETQVRTRTSECVEDARMNIESALVDGFFGRAHEDPSSPLNNPDMRSFMLRVAGGHAPTNDQIADFGILEFRDFITAGNSREERTEAIFSTIRSIGESDPIHARALFDSVHALEQQLHIRLLGNASIDDIVPSGGRGPAAPESGGATIPPFSPAVQARSRDALGEPRFLRQPSYENDILTAYSDDIGGAISHAVPRQYVPMAFEGQFVASRDRLKPSGVWLSWGGGWHDFMNIAGLNSRGSVTFDAEIRSGLRLFVIRDLPSYERMMNRFRSEVPRAQRAGSEDAGSAWYSINEDAYYVTSPWEWLRTQGYDGVAVDENGANLIRDEMPFDVASIAIFNPQGTVRLANGEETFNRYMQSAERRMDDQVSRFSELGRSDSEEAYKMLQQFAYGEEGRPGYFPGFLRFGGEFVNSLRAQNITIEQAADRIIEYVRQRRGEDAREAPRSPSPARPSDASRTPNAPPDTPSGRLIEPRPEPQSTPTQSSTSHSESPLSPIRNIPETRAPAGQGMAPALHQAHVVGEPQYISRHRARSAELEATLAAHQESIRTSAPQGSTEEGLRLYSIAYDQGRAAEERYNYGTPNERDVALALRGDTAYSDAMARQDYIAAMEMAERYASLVQTLDRAAPTIRSGEHVDEVVGARRVIAIGDVHGDARALVGQLTHGRVLVDTMPHLAADDASVPLAQRYRLNPDLPAGTEIIFTGDFVDRGPSSMDVLDVVRQMRDDAAYSGSRVHALRGNHEALFLRFVNAYRGYTTEQVREILRTGNLPDGSPDPLAALCHFNRVGMGLSEEGGVQGTFDQVVARHGSWENFISSNITPDGSVVPGSALEFILSTRGAVIIDNNYFTHGGPVMTREVREAPNRDAALTALDSHFTQLFGTRARPVFENSWASVHFDLDAMNAGDFSANYVDQWSGRLSAADGEQFRHALGIDQVYVGHMPTNSNAITRFGDFATAIDVGMTSHYGGGRGFLDINPLNREAPVLARAEMSGSDRNLTDGRQRTAVLRNQISESAAGVLGESRGMPMAQQPAEPHMPPAPEAPMPQQHAAPLSHPPPVSQADYQAERARLAGSMLSFFDEHFAQLPDAMTLDNAMAVLGDRNGARSGITGLFDQVLLTESIGGNAGRGHAAVNAYFDTGTGRISAFGNPQNIPQEILSSHVRATFRINLETGRIEGITGANNAPIPPSIAPLVGMRVREGTPPDAMAIARSRARARQTPVQERPAEFMQRIRDTVSGYEASLRLRPQDARQHNPEIEMLGMLVGDTSTLPPIGTPERAARLETLAEQALSDSRSADALASEYARSIESLRGGGLYQIPEGMRQQFFDLADTFTRMRIDPLDANRYVIGHVAREVALRSRRSGRPLQPPLEGAERLQSLFNSYRQGNVPPEPDDERAMHFIESRTPSGGEPAADVIEQANRIHALATRSTAIQLNLDILPDRYHPEARAFERRMRDLIWEFPEQFMPVREVRMGDMTVGIGSPMRLGGEVGGRAEDFAIPVFIRGPNGRSRLVMAYRSESQRSWRRFVGEAGTYIKGDRRVSLNADDPPPPVLPESYYFGEHFQNFDSRIQRELESAFIGQPPADMSRDGRARLELSDFGISINHPDEREIAFRLAFNGESIMQERMNDHALALDLSNPGNRPSRVVDYWWAGGEGSVYGRHPVILAESENGLFQYAIAATRDGMFVEYVQPARFDEINVVGAPTRGVLLQDDSLLRPIVEYYEQMPEDANARGTRIGSRGGRVRIEDLHASADDPLHEVNNGLSPLYPMLRLGRFEDADTLLGSMLLPIEDARRRPLTSSTSPAEVPAESVEIRAQARLNELQTAYRKFEQGTLRAQTQEGIQRMRELHLSEEDLYLFERYRDATPQRREWRLNQEALRQARAEFTLSQSEIRQPSQSAGTGRAARPSAEGTVSGRGNRLPPRNERQQAQFRSRPFDEQAVISNLGEELARPFRERNRDVVGDNMTLLAGQPREVRTRVHEAVRARLAERLGDSKRAETVAQEILIFTSPGAFSAEYRPAEELTIHIPSRSISELTEPETQLLRQVWKRGERDNLDAQGTAKVGLYGLVNIILEGQVTRGYTGPLDSSNYTAASSGPHGPYYVIIDRTAEGPLRLSSSGVQILGEQTHTAYVVPSEAEQRIIAQALNEAVSLDLMTHDEAIESMSRVVTYQQFIDAPPNSFRHVGRFSLSRHAYAERMLNGDFSPEIAETPQQPPSSQAQERPAVNLSGQTIRISAADLQDALRERSQPRGAQTPAAQESHSQQALDLVAITGGTLSRNPTSTERVIADMLMGNADYLNARNTGDNSRMLRIAEHFARYVDSASRVVIRQQDVEAAARELHGMYEHNADFRGFVDERAREESTNPDSLLGEMALQRANTDAAERMRVGRQFSDTGHVRRSMRFENGNRIREEAFVYGGERRGIPEQHFTMEQYDGAVRTILEAERIIELGLDHSSATPWAQELLNNPAFVSETLAIIDANNSGVPVDRFAQMGIALRASGAD